jgi:enoyl-[acyl-carrier protein] reductase I
MTENGKLMAGKRGLVMGVANNRSIAWGITRACHQQGADIALTYQGEALKKRVVPLAEEIGSTLVLPCDVTDTASMDGVFAALAKEWGGLDFVVHAIAYSDKEQLDGRYVDTTPENFAKTLAISCYSFTAIAQRAEKLMKEGGSLLTLTYYGAEKVMPHYNVMGVAKAILKWNEFNSPLRRTVSIDDVGGAAMYLLSDLARGVTGEVHHVDAGYHIVGMKNEDAPDISVVKE